MNKITQLTCPHLFLDIVMALFSLHKGECKKYKQELDVFTILAVTNEELAKICRRIDDKTPG